MPEFSSPKERIEGKRWYKCQLRAVQVNIRYNGDIATQYHCPLKKPQHGWVSGRQGVHLIRFAVFYRLVTPCTMVTPLHSIFIHKAHTNVISVHQAQAPARKKFLYGLQKDRKRNCEVEYQEDQPIIVTTIHSCKLLQKSNINE